MHVWYRYGMVVGGLSLLLSSSTVAARVLESPADGAVVSGIGFISGWKCDAGNITVRIDGGAPISVAMGQPRADTAAICGTTDNGFITQANWSWAWLGAGEHEAVAYDNGVEFGRATFTVGTTGTEFLRGVVADYRAADFPRPGSNGRFIWNESTQHLELAEAGNHVRLGASLPWSGDSVEHWAEEWVDACYRRADQLPNGSLHQYREHVKHCIRHGQEVGYSRLWRDRYVRELIQKITEEDGQASLEAWFLDDWDLGDCHPYGDINPDVYVDHENEPYGNDGDCGLFSP